MREKKEKNKIITNDNRGITLIAVAVTILILLILAGITISTLSGNNNIIDFALKSKKLTDSAKIEEEVKNASLAAAADGKGIIKQSPLERELGIYLGKRGIEYTLTGDSSSGWTVTVPNEQTTFKIDLDGDVANLTELIKNYGTVVEGYNADNREWQVFYAGVKETFLITKPIITFGQIPTTSVSGYNYNGITDVEKLFYGRNWNKKCIENAGNGGNYDNKKATAYMCDPENWTKYYEEPANYAVGGATLELFVASWNDTHDEDKQISQVNCSGIGYTVPSLLGRTNILDANDCNGIYKATSYYWLASPSRDRSDCMISVAGGNLKYLSGGFAITNGRSIRPIVSIPTNKIKVDGERVIVD